MLLIMNPRPITTLKDIVLKDQEMKQLLECEQHDNLEWNQIINDMLSDLFLPSEISDELGISIKGVYLLLKKCYTLHKHFSLFWCDQCECLKGFSQSLCKLWQTDTVFDERKTVKCLIRDESLSDVLRFILVGEYILEGDDRSAFQQMVCAVERISHDIPEEKKVMMREKSSILCGESQMIVEMLMSAGKI